jgi:hypothetical protein
MRNLPTGEPCAGDLPARFGGRGGPRALLDPYQFRELESLRGKVFPLGIHLFDQPDLPRAVPLLEPLLPLNRLVHASVHLEVHERVHTVLLGKSVHATFPMRFDAIGEIACYAYIQRSVGFAGEDVHHRLLHSASNALTRAWVDSETDWIPPPTEAFGGDVPSRDDGLCPPSPGYGFTGSPPSRGRPFSAFSEFP